MVLEKYPMKMKGVLITKENNINEKKLMLTFHFLNNFDLYNHNPYKNIST